MIPYRDLRGATDASSRRFIRSDYSGTNLPIPEGWKACLVWGGIETSVVSAAVEPLAATLRTPPYILTFSISFSFLRGPTFDCLSKLISKEISF